MKTIKDLTIKVTYTVGLSNVQVSDDVYEALSNCYDEGGQVTTDGFDNEEQTASEWLSDHVHESDAIDWEYEIKDFNDLD
ncbi:hypothetical protein [Phocaeicola dorei]|jgi:hypothetical protein|uniref:hypothetical protein n=1 Tax=Phocaeicola dorei TaxID=357276 RepID=UPI001BDEF71F|nr:hypothetical protein [Phocaeicola dorei]MBT1285937.1 hypothetical protein [Phocaeicola dorei]MBT1289806.1 hypothetical protein [Phocaeicola dorei]